MQTSFFNSASTLRWIVFCTLYFCSLNASFAQAQLAVSGNSRVINNGNESFTTSNFTDFGVAINKSIDVSANQINRTFILFNTGNADLNVSNIALYDPLNFFNIEKNATGIIGAGQTAELSINFNSHQFGTAYARVTIQSNDANGDFTFFIRGVNAECNTNNCWGFEETDQNVCGGNGNCIAKDVCQCSDGYTGTNCQTPILWEDGTVTQTRQFDFSQHIVVGPELSDPKAVYTIDVKINSSDHFPSSKGYSFGVISVPPNDLTHEVGDDAYEYGYLASGELLNDGIMHSFGNPIDVGDTFRTVYDAISKTITYYVQKGSQGDFVLLGDGPAFTNVQPKPHTILKFATSVRCFGFCSITLMH